nr:FAD-binding oxidoreductase [Paraglaciecola sp. 20A4]
MVIIEASCEEDIRLAINFANEHNLAISVKGGGHSNTGSCVVNDGIVLDMSTFKSISLAEDRQSVRLGAGVRNRELDAYTTQYGLAVPLGTCPDVGVIGATLGGGIGFLSRKFGLTCDSLVNVTMIDALGIKRIVDKVSDPDLFWALSGGGGCQFGVITEITLKVYVVPSTVIGGFIEWPICEAKKVLKHYSDEVLSSARDYFVYAYLSRASQGREKISIMVFSTATKSECDAFFKRISNWGIGAKMDISEKTYLEMQANAYQSELCVYWRNGFVSHALSSQFIDDVIDCYVNCPDDYCGIMFDPLGGAIQDRACEDSAFVHRKSNFICSVTGISGGVKIVSEIERWVDDSHATLSTFYNGQAYQNYEFLAKDELKSYFGKNSLKLLALKHRYDPKCRFYGSLSRHLIEA